MAENFPPTRQYPHRVDLRYKKNIFLFFFLLGNLSGFSQSDYVARLRETSTLLPNAPVKADSTLKILLQEIMAVQPPGSDSLRIITYSLLGSAQLYQGKLNLALDYYNKSLYENRNNLVPRQIMACTVNKAIIFEKQFNFEEAAATYQKALEYAERSKDSSAITGIWQNISILHHKLKNDDKAIEIMEKLYSYYLEQHDTLRMANALQNIATCFYPARLNQVEKYLRQSLALYRTIKHPYFIASNTNNLASLLIYQEKYAEAHKLLLENITFCEKNGITEAHAIAYRFLATCEIESGMDVRNVPGYLEKAHALALASNRSDILRDLKETELLLQVRAGDYKGAVKILESYKTLYDESARENARVINTEFQTLYEVKQISEQKNMLQKGINLRNRQLVISLAALFAAILAIVIIVMQYLRIRQALRTMYRMNVEIANSAPAGFIQMEMPAVENAAATEVTEENESINMANLYGAILMRLEQHRLYLDPGFSIQNLAESMNRSTRYLSQAISEVGKTNFPNLINKFRVNEARRLLSAGHNMPIHEVMQKSGFGSRQTFNRNFKAATGFTPADFQDMASNVPANLEGYPADSDLAI